MDGESPLATTLVVRVMDHVRSRIAARALAPGARLPSLRALAQELAVSKFTVVEAYDRLAADGVIEPRRGSGFYVTATQPAAPLRLNRPEPEPERKVDPFWVMRQSLTAANGVAQPGCGWLPASWLPEANIRQALRATAREAEAEALVGYGQPLGHEPLRMLQSRRLAERGVEAHPDQIVLTDSGTQAIDLLCRFLLKPGDAVMVDDPCYFNFDSILRAQRATIVPVPFTPGGPDLDAFAAALETHKPRLYLTNSAIQNPTGACLSPVTAHRILKLAEAHDLLIVEDDIFADFEGEPAAPRLAAFDGLQRVAMIGSFSKTLSAAARCGFIAVRADWVEGLVDLKLATSFASASLSAGLVHRLLVDGSYRKHVERLRERLAGAMTLTLRRLRTLGLRPWIEPRFGMFVWAELPDGLDAAAIARRALPQGVVLAPGPVFSRSPAAAGFLRFNAAQCADPRIFEVLAAAMRERG